MGITKIIFYRKIADIPTEFLGRRMLTPAASAKDLTDMIDLVNAGTVDAVLVSIGMVTCWRCRLRPEEVRFVFLGTEGWEYAEIAQAINRISVWPASE